MKNKKLVATVASLCLVVVAVVAAVVGVFAAVTQNASATLNVSYFAKNVYATITLESKGPTYDSTGKTRSYYTESSAEAWEHVTAQGTSYTHTFNPGNQTQAPATSSAAAAINLSAITYDLGWDSEANSQTFMGKAVYRFAFTNNNTSSNINANSGSLLKVTLSSTVADENLQVLFYKPKTAGTAALSMSDITANWNADGDLQNGFGLNSTNFDTMDSGDNLPNIAVGATNYIFMVVIVKDMQADVNLSVLNNALTFTLEDVRAPQAQSNG